MSDIDHKESLLISGEEFSLSLITFSGKDGEFHIEYSPSLELSGYGRTPEEAGESLLVSIKAFLADLRDLPVKKQEEILKSLGWFKEHPHHENYSHAYVDQDGIIQGLGLENAQAREVGMTF